MILKGANDNGPAQRTTGLDERIGSLFQPDTLLGEDYAANFRRKLPLEAERTLLLAVLEDGIRCYQENIARDGRKKADALRGSARVALQRRRGLVLFVRVDLHHAQSRTQLHPARPAPVGSAAAQAGA